ncbi:unnamed protein product [Jaminaea pallidilutea]
MAGTQAIPPALTSILTPLSLRLRDVNSFQLPRLSSSSSSSSSKAAHAVFQGYEDELNDALSECRDLIEKGQIVVDYLLDEIDHPQSAISVEWSRIVSQYGEARTSARRVLLEARKAIAQRKAQGLLRGQDDEADNAEQKYGRSASYAPTKQSKVGAGNTTSSHGRGDDASLIASSNLTSSLQSTLAQLSTNVSQSQLTLEMLQTSTEQLSTLNFDYATFSTLLKNSGSILKSMERRDKIDAAMLAGCYAFFFLCIAYILKVRIWDRGVGVVMILLKPFGLLGRGKFEAAVAEKAAAAAAAASSSSSVAAQEASQSLSSVAARSAAASSAAAAAAVLTSSALKASEAQAQAQARTQTTAAPLGDASIPVASQKSIMEEIDVMVGPPSNAQAAEPVEEGVQMTQEPRFEDEQATDEVTYEDPTAIGKDSRSQPDVAEPEPAQDREPEVESEPELETEMESELEPEPTHEPQPETVQESVEEGRPVSAETPDAYPAYATPTEGQEQPLEARETDKINFDDAADELPTDSSAPEETLTDEEVAADEPVTGTSSAEDPVVEEPVAAEVPSQEEPLVQDDDEGDHHHGSVEPTVADPTPAESVAAGTEAAQPTAVIDEDVDLELELEAEPEPQAQPESELNQESEPLPEPRAEPEPDLIVDEAKPAQSTAEADYQEDVDDDDLEEHSADEPAFESESESEDAQLEPPADVEEQGEPDLEGTHMADLHAGGGEAEDAIGAGVQGDGGGEQHGALEDQPAGEQEQEQEQEGELHGQETQGNGAQGGDLGGQMGHDDDDVHGEQDQDQDHEDEDEGAGANGRYAHHDEL